MEDRSEDCAKVGCKLGARGTICTFGLYTAQPVHGFYYSELSLFTRGGEEGGKNESKEFASLMPFDDRRNVLEAPKYAHGA